MTQRLKQHRLALGDLVKMQIFNSAGLEWGPRFCIANKLPDVVHSVSKIAAMS